MKKILLFKLDEVAYNSTRLFADVLGEEFRRLGAEVDFFDIKEHSEIAELEAYTKKQYDCVIDFNSKLPRLVNEDDSYFLDDFHAPFYNYIVDHPAYHHKNLACTLKDYHVLCLDNMYAQYIRSYYPHIKNVMVRPLGALRADQFACNQNIPVRKWADRTHTLLFMGTYLDPKGYMNVINDLPADMRLNIKNVIDQMMEDPSAPYEESLLKAAGDSVMCQSAGVAAFAQMMCLADIYVRAVYRNRVIKAYADTGIAMTICGENYEKSGLKDYTNVTILPQVDYAQSLALIADAKYVLNVMPWFKSGIHDRVVNAMMNGAVSVSDGSLMMDRYFQPGVDYIQYSISDLTTIHNPTTIQNPEARVLDGTLKKGYAEGAAIAEHGQSSVANMTFAQIASDILQLL